MKLMAAQNHTQTSNLPLRGLDLSVEHTKARIASMESMDAQKDTQRSNLPPGGVGRSVEQAQAKAKARMGRLPRWPTSDLGKHKM